MTRAMIAILIALCAASATHAATFTVDTILDLTDDDVGDGICESLHGTLGNFTLSCSLRGAIEQANATPGPDTIEFSIAGSIRPESLGSLPQITETLVIDGRTAPGFNTTGTDLASRPPMIVLDGEFLAPSTNSLGLWLVSGNLSLYALAIVNFESGVALQGEGSDAFQGNYIGLYPDGTAGSSMRSGITVFVPSTIGKQPIAGGFSGFGNVISGVVSLSPFVDTGVSLQSGARGSELYGNLFGTTPDGLQSRPNEADVSAMADDNVIGGGSGLADGGNLFGGNVSVSGDGALIEGNQYGIALDGSSLVDRDDPLSRALRISGDDVTVGSFGSGNFFGSYFSAINFGATSSGGPSNALIVDNIFHDNRTAIIIAEDIDTVIVFNQFDANETGIFTLGTRDATIAANVFTNQTGPAVRVFVDSFGVAIRENQYSGNAEAIELEGVAGNDPDDDDEAVNRGQNSPELSIDSFTPGVSGGGVAPQLEVSYRVDSAATNAAYPIRVELYLTSDANANQGEQFLESQMYVTPQDLDSINLSLPEGTIAGRLIALAIDGDGNTSEFSSSVSFGLPEELFSDGFESP